VRRRADLVYPPAVRKHILSLVVVGIAALSSQGFMGCTSLLGDFEVDPSLQTGVDGGEGGVCTVCNGQCVDVTSNAFNCGACGVVCPGGQTCQASACKCEVDKAFCGGQCVGADREHCGGTCAACQADEVCSSGCVAAPGAAFDGVLRDPVGWIDGAGAPFEIKLKPTGVPGTIYECRTGPEATFTPTEPAWKPCDGGAGTTPVYKPTPTAGKEEGSYRTEHRYRSDTYRSASAVYSYYIHHSLDRAAVCPRPGNAADGPRFTDAQYFLAAQTHAGAFGQFSPERFPLADTFPLPGAVRTDAFYLRNPFIKIPFRDIRIVGYLPTWPNNGQLLATHTVEERSLRHQFVLNPSRTMLLMKRQYENPVTKDCQNKLSIGNEIARQLGPDGFDRGHKLVDCEALVMTVHGLGLCMVPNAAKTAPEPYVVDNFLHPGNPGFGTLNLTANNPTVTLTGGSNSFVAGWLNKWLYIPGGGQFGRNKWYKITAIATPTSITLTPTPLSTIASPAASWRYNYQPVPEKHYVLPTGFAKLYQNGKNWATHSPEFNPSFTTKCETEGCNAGKPWMTYLPP